MRCPDKRRRVIGVMLMQRCVRQRPQRKVTPFPCNFGRHWMYGVGWEKEPLGGSEGSGSKKDTGTTGNE